MSHRLSLARLLWVVAPLAGGGLALWLGQDANWDLRNYHFYVAYAFLEGRQGYDMAPSQVASFYNPLFYVPFYYGVLYLSAPILGFLLGALQGLNAPLLYLIGRQVLAQRAGGPSPVPPLLLALAAVSGAGFLSEIGTSFGDTVLSLLVLTSLWLNLRALRRLQEAGNARIALFVSGVLVGMAAGLKQPLVVYAVGLNLAFLLTPGQLGRNMTLALVFGLGVVAGVAAGGGYWMYELWQRYANPFFPFFNPFFQSPWASVADYRDLRFVPQGLLDTLLFPFFFVWAPLRTAEVPFRDLRIAAQFLAIGALGVAWLMGWARARHAAEGVSGLAPQTRYLLAFTIVTFVVWLELFAIYRYVIVLEMLAPLATWLVLRRVLPTRWAAPVGIAGLVLLALTTRPADWGRVGWARDYFGVEVPPLPQPDDTIVLIAGKDPLAYLIPYFPKGVRFLRVESYFTGPSATANRFTERIRDILTEHRGPTYALYRSYEQETMVAVLAAYDRVLEPRRCTRLEPHIESNLPDPLFFCAVSAAERKR